MCLTWRTRLRPTLSFQHQTTATSGKSPRSDALQDTNWYRIWKSDASKKIGPVSTKERQAMEYRQKLVDKWSTTKDVRSVAERRFVPASIHNTTKLKRDMIEAQKTKEDRRRKHSRAGKEKPKAERKSGWTLATQTCCVDSYADAPFRGRHHRAEVMSDLHDFGSVICTYYHSIILSPASTLLAGYLCV